MSELLPSDHPIAGVHADGLVWSLDFPASEDGPAWTWQHYDLVNARARNEVARDAGWPEEIHRMLLSQDESPQIVLNDDGLIAGVLPSYARTGDTDEFEVTAWHFAASDTRIVTTRRRAVRSAAAVYHQVRAGRIAGGPAAIVFLALTEFAREARKRLGRLADDLDAIEDTLLLPRWHGPLSQPAGRIGQTRREAVILRRVLAPIARVLDELQEEAPAWVQTDELEPTHGLVLGVLDDITALNERARSLQDELQARQADETNRRLYTVSLVTTLMMPATFVTGFFGMNTTGLPWSGELSHAGTIYAGLACIIAVLMTLALLKWKRLL